MSSGTSSTALHVAPSPPDRSASRRARRPGTGRPMAMCGMPEPLGEQRRPGFPCRPLARQGACHRHDGLGDHRAAAQPDEAFVVAHHQLRLDLLHRLDHDGHDDQQARAAEPDGRRGPGTTMPMSDRRDGHRCARKSAPAKRDAADDLGQVVLRRAARPDARDEAAVLAQLLGRLVGLERERRVEVREADRQQEVQDDVDGSTAG